MIGGALGDVQSIFSVDGFFHEMARAMAHGVSQGGLSELAGGEFSSGFIAGFSGSAFGSAMVKVPGMGKAGDFSDGRWALRTTAAATVGGTVSELSGGDFANGATTAAFVHLFNQEAHGMATNRVAGRGKRGPATARNENPIQGKTHGRGPVEVNDGTVFTIGVSGKFVKGAGPGVGTGLFFVKNGNSTFGYDVGIYVEGSANFGGDTGGEVNFGGFNSVENFQGNANFVSYSAAAVGQTFVFDDSGNHGGVVNSFGPQLGASSGRSSVSIIWSSNSAYRSSTSSARRVPVRNRNR